MNSFEKIFEIFEYVVLQCGKAVTPSEAASATGLHLATCSRIMTDLAERGYLEQLSRRSGYVPGPMTVTLGTRPNRYAELAEAAEKPIEKLADALNRQINLSVLNHGKRIMLICKKPFEYMRWQRFRFAGEYDTAATARLLAPFLPEDQFAETGISAAERKRILKEKRVQFPLKERNLVIFGNLILAEGYPPAAFGFGVPEDSDLKKVRLLSDRTAAEIEQKLNPSNQTY